MSTQDRDYHVLRARAELDLAYSSQNKAAADAHMRLSALHMGVLKQADNDCCGAELEFTR